MSLRVPSIRHDAPWGAWQKSPISPSRLPHLFEPIRALLPPEAMPQVEVIESLFGGFLQ